MTYFKIGKPEVIPGIDGIEFQGEGLFQVFYTFLVEFLVEIDIAEIIVDLEGAGFQLVGAGKKGKGLIIESGIIINAPKVDHGQGIAAVKFDGLKVILDGFISVL